MDITDLLTSAVQAGASDLHLKSGSYPMMRVHGALCPIVEDYRFDPATLAAIAAGLVPASLQQHLAREHVVDFAHSVAELGRFRCNVFRQRGTIAMVLRVIPIQVSSIEDLELPPVLKTIAEGEHGLILLTGTTGSGKSTTLAALIDHINHTRAAHIMTVEDPIEYLHHDQQSIINQRELDIDTKSFAQALRSALRQDPDVILVGEMRDLETVETGLTAAETGHLVIPTVHTLDATETINRLIAVFPPHQHRQLRLQLASVLRAVISQRLMPSIRRNRAYRRRRGHGQHSVRGRLHRGPRTHAPHPTRNRRGHVAIRDADLRPVDLRTVSARPDLLRHGAAEGEQPRRVQAACPGCDFDRGRCARRDGPPAAGQRGGAAYH